MSDWYVFALGKPRRGCKAHLIDDEWQPICASREYASEPKPAPDYARYCLDCERKAAKALLNGTKQPAYRRVVKSIQKWPIDIRPAVDLIPIEPGGPVHQSGFGCWCEPERRQDEIGPGVDACRHFNRGVG